MDLIEQYMAYHSVAGRSDKVGPQQTATDASRSEAVHVACLLLTRAT